MPATLWLIVEAETDAALLKSLAKTHFPKLHVEYFTASGGSPNLNRLDEQLEDLIRNAKRGTPKRPATAKDCIVVVHDNDNIQSGRAAYDSIKRKCRAAQVTECIAIDEIEAWVLSDSGVSKWLGIPQKPWNADQRPSDELRRLLNKEHGLKYPSCRAKVLDHMKWDGQNTSLQETLKTLRALPCTRA
jgi:hypothetical protein